MSPPTNGFRRLLLESRKDSVTTKATKNTKRKHKQHDCDSFVWFVYFVVHDLRHAFTASTSTLTRTLPVRSCCMRPFFCFMRAVNFRRRVLISDSAAFRNSLIAFCSGTEGTENFKKLKSSKRSCPLRIGVSVIA